LYLRAAAAHPVSLAADGTADATLISYLTRLAHANYDRLPEKPSSITSVNRVARPQIRVPRRGSARGCSPLRSRLIPAYMNVARMRSGERRRRCLRVRASPPILRLSVGAVGIEQFIVHADDGLSATGRWALPAGVTLSLIGCGRPDDGHVGALAGAWPWPLAVVPLIGLLGLIDGLSPTLLIGTVAALLVATLLAGIRKQRHGDLQNHGDLIRQDTALRRTVNPARTVAATA
jgi:hypothetical protein